MHRNSLTCLVAGAGLMALVASTVAVPIAVWIALTLLLRATRSMPAWPGLGVAFLALYVAEAVGSRGSVPLGGAFYFVVVVAITATAILPFLVDRLVATRLPGWASTLVFPMTWAAVELVNTRLAPSASWGSIAYTQYGDLPLMQLAALTGLPGISFLVCWFASTVVWAWERDFEWTAIRQPVVTFATVLGLVVLGGSLRLAWSPPPTHPVRAAVVSFPRDMFAPGEATRITEGRVAAGQAEAVRAKLARLHDWFLERSAREATAGARLVAWPEANLLVLRQDEPGFLVRARRLALERGLYLLMGMGSIEPGAHKPFENKAVLIDPAGNIVFSYRKSRPVPGWEQSIMKPGNGRLPFADTALGRVAAGICFDADFPQLVRQVGRARADLWILPANDWEAIKGTHLAMAAFRAVENGVPTLRATSAGLSGAFDSWGRVLAMTDHVSGAPTMVVELPTGGVPTFYARVGDLFGWCCLGGCLLAVAGALTRGAWRSDRAELSPPLRVSSSRAP